METAATVPKQSVPIMVGMFMSSYAATIYQRSQVHKLPPFYQVIPRFLRFLWPLVMQDLVIHLIFMWVSVFFS